MKYILLMSGTKTGVDGYHAWSQKDIEAHMAVLQGITEELTKSGEFVASQGLADPGEAKLVRGRKTESRLQTGFFPSSKSFCWDTGSLTLRRLNAHMPSRAGFRWRRDLEEYLPTCPLKFGGWRFMCSLSPNDSMSRTWREIRLTYESVGRSAK